MEDVYEIKFRNGHSMIRIVDDWLVVKSTFSKSIENNVEFVRTTMQDFDAVDYGSLTDCE